MNTWFAFRSSDAALRPRRSPPRIRLPSQSAPCCQPLTPTTTHWLWRPASPSADVMSGPGWQESWPGGATSLTPFLLLLLLSSVFFFFKRIPLPPSHSSLPSCYSFLFGTSSLSFNSLSLLFFSDLFSVFFFFFPSNHTSEPLFLSPIPRSFQPRYVDMRRG